MLHSLLLICKIVGIVILFLLGIALIALGLLLFCPIRYRVEAESFGEWREARIKVRFSWFLHLVSGYAFYEEQDFRWDCRLAFWKLQERRKKKNQESEKQQARKRQVDSEGKPDKKKSNKKVKPTKKQSSDETQSKEKKDSFFQKIPYTFRRICDKIKLISRGKEQLVEFVEDEVHRSAFGKVLQEVRRLGRILRPKRLRLYLRFGCEDPANTGIVLAFLSMCYSVYGDEIRVEPDFEEALLEGELHMRGTLYGIGLLMLVCRLYFDEQVKCTYRHITEWSL